MLKNNRTLQKLSITKAAMLGTVVAVIVTGIFLVAGAICINNEYFAITNRMYYSHIAQSVSVFTGAIASACLNKEKRGICVLSVSAAYYLLCACAGILLFEGMSKGALGGAFAVIIGGVLALLSQKGIAGQSVKRRKRKRTW